MTKTISPMLVTKVTTKKYVPVWFTRDFAVMSKEFNQVRSRLKKTFSNCFGCGKAFQIGSDDKEGEAMHIVSFKGHTNELICTECLCKIFGDKASMKHWHSESEVSNESK